MYICICNGIREKDLRACARDVAGDAEQVYSALGRTPQCRMCLEEAERIVADARTWEKPPVSSRRPLLLTA